ncbi:MAG TPA: cbb3-type cytochrome oxidase assembly protein CcoS [Saprospiraceae bacterium]|nr:cbb3-type cytochrome oxidase assembly protein CcoS [Saprospiraceae bacterium]
MKVIFLLILASLVVAAGFLYAFIWAVRDGQFEDDYTPAVRILFDDGTLPKAEQPPPEAESKE